MYAVYCVRTPPTVDPMTPPRGAPAEKVANANDRARDGGKASARIPSYEKFSSVRDIS